MFRTLHAGTIVLSYEHRVAALRKSGDIAESPNRGRPVAGTNRSGAHMRLHAGSAVRRGEVANHA